MKLAAVLAVSLLAITTATAAAEEQAPVDKKDKVVCRTDKMTGSRTKIRRTCMTRAQWDEVERKTKKGLDEFNSSAAGGLKSPDNAAAMMGGT